jgi:hypothetical protein
MLLDDSNKGARKQGLSHRRRASGAGGGPNARPPIIDTNIRAEQR